MKQHITLLNLIIFTLAASLSGCTKGGSESHDHDHDHEKSAQQHEEHGESAHIELSQQQMDAVGIRLGTLEARNMSTAIAASGRLEVSATEESVVAPRLSGTITKLCVNQGESVTNGETIAFMECPELLTLRQEYLTASQEVGVAQKEVDRQQALASQGAGVRKNLDNAQAVLSAARLKAQGIMAQISNYGLSAETLAKSGNTSIPVKAGMSGTVTEILSTAGGYADPQNPIIKIVNTSGIYCMLQLLEKDLTSVKAGQTVEMKLTNNPAVTFQGRIISINPMLDSTTHSAPVKVSIANRPTDFRLIPGMAVTAEINLMGTLSEVVPEEAVVSAEGKSYIFLLKDTEEEKGVKMYHFEKVEVATGATSMGYTEITPLTTLPDNPQIVVGGAFYLNSMSTEHGEHSH